jgi:uncharacterized protein (TIGR03435 family)
MRRVRVFIRSGVVLLGILMAATAGAQMRPGLPEVGQPAPALHLAQVIGGPSGGQLNWGALRGRVVVVEFWATWCPPCVGSIPHLNDLERQFTGQPVEFLSISYEDPEVVKKFLASHPIRGWVGVDEKRETLDDFGVRFLPLTVIVDRQGRIAALTQPMALKEAALREFLAGGHPALPGPLGMATPMAAGREPAEPVARAAPLFYLDVRPDTTPIGALAFDREGGRVTAVGWPAQKLLSLLLQVPEDRIAGADLLPKGRYTVVAAMPPGQANELTGEIERTLGLVWGVRLRQEERQTDVYLLTAPHGRPAGLVPATAAGGNMAVKGRSMAALARMLEDRLGRPVIDETHLDGAYHYSLNLPPGEAAGVVRSVEGLGLELKQARRKLAVVVVEKRGK